MNDNFSKIKDLYKDSFKKFGDSPKSLLTPKGRNHLRFRSIDPFVFNDGVKILDFGCGLGYLYRFLLDQGRCVQYTGVDILPDFIDACSKKYPDATFKQIDALGELNGNYDVVFSSGVFNITTHSDPIASKSYAFERILTLYDLAQEVLICDFLSTFVDYHQQDSQHFSPSEIIEFCYSKLSRRFQIRHDLLPYEFSLLAFKNDSIKRPENSYAIDS